MSRIQLAAKVSRAATTIGSLSLGWAAFFSLDAQSPDDPPPVRREFRAVWVASVSNIDWPSRPGLGTWQQQSELLAILNRAVQLNMNAVILQVRPATDALYASTLEPWSEYLSGQMGRPPEPPYDPLEFAVTEAHKRGLELHAWFNPYRSRHPSGRSELSTNHLSRVRPDLVRTYGRHLWMDPGDPGVRRHSVKVITDVVRRYDLDGIHIDDYFYPYKERNSAGVIIDFPDSSTYARYQRAGGVLGRDDWRRQNVDMFVRELYEATKRTKRWVKVGISPFGIWRSGIPHPIRGFDAYAEIYADSRKWLNNGWLDYFTPQLYWQIGRAEVSYPVLLEWWVAENSKGRNIWPGNFTNRVGGAAPDGWPVREILDQIALTRAQRGASGNVHFSARSLMQSRDSLVERLAETYSDPALVPASPWLDSTSPRTPLARVRADEATGVPVLEITPRGREKAWLWVVRSRRAGQWTTAILPGSQRSHWLARPGPGGTPEAAPDMVLVSSVDRTGNESLPGRATYRPSSAPRN